MKRSALILLPLTLGIILVSFPGTAPRILFYLIVGWIPYLFRVLPKVDVRLDGVSLFLAGIVLLGFVIHPIARWLRNETSNQESWWKWRSTGMLISSVVVMFVAGIAMIGITHQTYWLLTDKSDLMVPTLPRDGRGNEYNLKVMRLGLVTSQEIKPTSDDTNRSNHSWVTNSLPFAGYLSEIDHLLPWDHPDNRVWTQKNVPTLLNPGLSPVVLHDKEGYGVSHYAGNSRVFDEDDRLKKIAFEDGKSKTLLIGEVSTSFQPWAKPNSNRDPSLGINRSPDGFGGPSSSGGAYFAMADGSVRFFSHDTAPEILRALGTPSVVKE